MRTIRRQGWSLMLKVPLTITGAVLGCALTVGLVIIQQNWVQQRAALESQTLLLAQITAASAPQAIMRGDVW